MGNSRKIRHEPIFKTDSAYEIDWNDGPHIFQSLDLLVTFLKTKQIIDKPIQTRVTQNVEAKEKKEIAKTVKNICIDATATALKVPAFIRAGGNHLENEEPHMFGRLVWCHINNVRKYCQIMVIQATFS